MTWADWWGIVQRAPQNAKAVVVIPPGQCATEQRLIDPV